MDNQKIKALFPIEEREDKKLVDARMLHQFLEVKSRFQDWIKNRIDQYGFWEDEDYVRFSENLRKTQGGRPTTEYGLTLDMAKELAMVENNIKGRQARRYFIECEKIAQKHLPANFPEALRELAASVEARLEIEKKLAIAAPKAEMYDITINTLGTISMLDMTKIIHHPTLGRTNLFKFLRKEGILMRNNLPMRRYEKHFDVVTMYIQHSEYEESKKVTRVYPSGISFIIGRIIKKLGGWDRLPSKDELDSRFNALAYQEEE